MKAIRKILKNDRVQALMHMVTVLTVVVGSVLLVMLPTLVK